MEGSILGFNLGVQGLFQVQIKVFIFRVWFRVQLWVQFRAQFRVQFVPSFFRGHPLQIAPFGVVHDVCGVTTRGRTANVFNGKTQRCFGVGSVPTGARALTAVVQTDAIVW